MNQYHVVFHSPGPKWQMGIDFREQPNVMDHVQHYAKLHEQGKLLHGGPFVDADTGGMMIATADVTRDELQKFASEDPAVISGLLNFEVKTWYMAMTKYE
jgi:uncharacterized protein